MKNRHLETRSQRFQRLAEKRVSKLLHQLHIIGNLSNRANYAYTTKEVNKIFRAIEKELATTKALYFTNVRPPIFTLGDSPKSIKKPLETPLKPQILPSMKDGKKKETKIASCSNCFENRSLQKYSNLWLCKRCYRKRKTIRKVRAINGEKGLRSFV